MPGALSARCLAEIKQDVSEGITMIFDRLGLEDAAWGEAAALPLDRLDAEIQYAEAAPDPERRMAMLLLDRERGERMLQAFALGDTDRQARAIEEINQWYDRGLGTIVTTEVPEFPEPAVEW